MIRILLYQAGKYRDGLSFFLNSIEGFQALRTLNGSGQVDKQVHESQPDVVLLDISLEKGMEVLTQIKKYNESIKVVILTDLADLSQVMMCLRSGADGYVLIKRTSLSALAECIKVANEGGFPMSPVLIGEVLKSIIPSNASFSSKENNSIGSKLTRRENEILQLLVNGLSYKAISFNLNIAIDTVRSHIKSIYEKLKVNSKSEAVVKALKENMAISA
jgi:DNA-binding NarL/FixJ family response regulator